MPDADYRNPTITHGWQHTLTLPRQLILHNDTICQLPVDELKALRRESVSFTGRATFVDSHAMELNLTNINNREVFLMIGFGLKVQYRADEYVFSISFDNESCGYGRTLRQVRMNNLSDLIIYIDHSVAEIYCNQGETVFTTRFYSSSPDCNVCIESDGLSGVVHYLNPLSVRFPY